MLAHILNKIYSNQRISTDDALYLYYNAPLSTLINLANLIKYNRYQKKVFYTQNVHIEPTNLCIYKCKFCSFHKEPHESPFWEYSIDDILCFLKNIPHSIKEIHITGGVHPNRKISWYITLFKKIKEIHPQAHIKAFTAIEIHHIAKISGLTVSETLQSLAEQGLSSIAGGGAEIFNEEIRKKLCPEKGTSSLWINVHKQAHRLGISSNATMLYGHIETIEHRVEHMHIIRSMQDETKGFLAFIPLKFRNQHNFLSYINEVSFIEDIKTFALSRIFFDNIDHIKAYWPMIGKEKAAFLLHAGADDIDGTIYNSTRIYSMSGSEEQQPSATTKELMFLIEKENFIPVERDIFYNEIII
ncbi:MAG: CofH family radical SAM protein [Bacteroidales bacterium]|nr:CofH family radical SAM protein [Bacteroidales bacterium]